jgi:hypothetical protein
MKRIILEAYHSSTGREILKKNKPGLANINRKAVI